MAPAVLPEPIEDDEVLYRRVPASQGWWNAARPEDGLSPQAFHPNRNDTDGISLFRAKHTSIEQAASGRPGKSYFIAVLNASDLKQAGIAIRATPTKEAPGHASLPELNYANRRSPEAKRLEGLLARALCLKVKGPFPTPADEET